jgi:hypothetical protein
MQEERGQLECATLAANDLGDICQVSEFRVKFRFNCSFTAWQSTPEIVTSNSQKMVMRTNTEKRSSAG